MCRICDFTGKIEVMSSNKHLSDNINWEDIQSMLASAENQTLLDNIDPKTFLLVLDENSRSLVIETILKMLERNDPDNATEKYASEIADLMSQVALKFGYGKIYKS